jgi:hypothetical protein
MAMISLDDRILNRLSQKNSEIDQSKQNNQSQISLDDRINKRIQDKEPEEEGFLKSLSRSVLQIPQGLAEVTTPGIATNLWQLLATGEVLDPKEIEHLEKIAKREGVEFDKEAYMKAAETALKNIPTVSNIATKLEEKTGIPLEPKTGTQHLIRFLSGFTKPSSEISKISPEAKAIQETAEEFKLPKYKGMELEKEPLIKPVIGEKKQLELTKKFDEASKKAIENIVEQKIPIKKMRENGINLEEAYTTAFKQTRATAEKMGNQSIDYNNVIRWINKEIKNIKSTSPSISDNQRAYINILKKEKNALLNPPKIEPAKEVSKLLSSSGEPLLAAKPEKLLPREIKHANADQILNQYQNFNSNIKSIWKKPEFTGTQNAVKNAYAGLKEQFIKSIEKTNPELAKELKFANKIFHETSKLNETEKIINKAFENGYNVNKLSKIIKTKRDRSFLERNIGKDGVKDLIKIAKYGEMAQEKVFNQLKNPMNIREYIEKMTPLDLMLIVGYKGHIKLPFTLSKAVVQRAQGYLFTRDTTRNNLINYLVEASKLGKNPKGMINAATRLNKSIEDEFGSENELLEMSSENNPD